MARGRLRRLLALLGCARGAAGLRAAGRPDPLNGVLGAPSVVVGGIGDSGTTAVIGALHRLGLVHCDKLNMFLEPVWAYYAPDGTPRGIVIRKLLESGNNQMTQAAYQTYPEQWEKALGLAHIASTKIGACIAEQYGRKARKALAGLTWGWKEPHWGWMLPVMDSAYELQTKYLIIARDPRDICTGDMQDQFHEYGEMLWIDNCHEWWAGYWNQLLNNYENTDRMRVVRIEDLVVPEPGRESTSLEVLQCVLKHVGLAAEGSAVVNALTELRGNFGSLLYRSPGREPGSEHELDDELRELDGFHNHTGSYMGKKKGQSEAVRKQQEHEMRDKIDPPVVHETMRRLGYDPMRFGLLKPASPGVCTR